MFGSAKDKAGDVAEKAAPVAEAAWEKTKDVAGDVAEKTAPVAEAAWEKTKDVAEVAADKAKDVVEGIKDRFDGDDDGTDGEQASDAP